MYSLNSWNEKKHTQQYVIDPENRRLPAFVRAQAARAYLREINKKCKNRARWRTTARQRSRTRTLRALCDECYERIESIEPDESVDESVLDFKRDKLPYLHQTAVGPFCWRI